MLSKLEFLISFFSTITELYNKNKRSFIFSLIILSVVCYYNQTEIKEIIGIEEKSRLDIFLERTTTLERDCQRICEEFNANNVTIFAIHNGIITNNDFHLMRYSEVAAYSPSLLVKKRFMNLPLYPYVRYVNICLDEGYFYAYDMKNHKDPIFRDVYKQTKNKSIIYLPIFKKRLLIGFTAIAFKKLHYFTELETGQMHRMNSLITGHMIN